MKLLNKNEYKKVEKLLINEDNLLDDNYCKAIEEIVCFFEDYIHCKFLEVFYFERSSYKNRFSTNSDLLMYLKGVLYVESTKIYEVRKEIVYKSAMIFYKYGVM